MNTSTESRGPQLRASSQRGLRAWLVLAVIAVAGCPFPEPEFAPPPDPAANAVTVEPRTDVVEAYPCNEQCHAEQPTRPTKYVLEEFHISKKLEHGTMLMWCYWCHVMDDLDQFRLLDDSLVPFNEAFRVCGQCHGDKLRDWKVGIHGRQTGFWAGPKSRASCPDCHNPHRPKDRRYTADPPPILTPQGNGAH